jgi:hypothetical protein
MGGAFAMATLTGVTITFNTYNEDKADDTIVHVFVRNRDNTSPGSGRTSDFVSNLLRLQRYLDGGDLVGRASGPYLAYGIGLGTAVGFDTPSSHTFTLTLVPDPVGVDDIAQPVVSVHILPDARDTWEFSYEVDFQFDDGTEFTVSPAGSGQTGIILDQDNRDYSGACAEIPPPPGALVLPRLRATKANRQRWILGPSEVPVGR